MPLRSQNDSKAAWWKSALYFRWKFREHRRFQYCMQMLRGSPLFNAAWYLQQYPDVADAGEDPCVHYLRQGALEGRNPGPNFDGNWYLERHPDIAAAAENPLVHYLEHGAAEGREIRPVIAAEKPAEQCSDLREPIKLLMDSSLFDADWYLREYPDVAAAEEDPAIHYLTFGAAEGRNPGPEFDGNWYLRCNTDVAAAGLNPLMHYLQTGAAERREIRRVIPVNALEKKLESRFIPLKPLNSFLIPPAPRRLNLVLDSVNPGFPGDGAGTALILAAVLAQRIGASLRFVTRVHALEPASFTAILSANGLTWSGEIEFVHAPPVGGRDLGISKNDFFVTTSWQTTRSITSVVNSSRVIYLVQADERLLYPFGDDRLRCEETLANPNLLFVIVSEMLFDHLTNGPDALESVRQRGVWFEPAFPNPQDPSATRDRRREAKGNFCFYANQSAAGNLYWRGLEVIGQALEEHILQSENWQLHFISDSPEDITLPGGIRPAIVANVPSPEYADFLRCMDVGLCLTDAPYPSAPILELAAAGKVVVTNRRGMRTSLARYSDNILCAEPTIDALKKEVGNAIRIASNDDIRCANHLRSRFIRDWTVALQPIVERLAMFADEGLV